MLRLALQDVLLEPFKTLLTFLALLGVTTGAALVLLTGESLMGAVDLEVIAAPAIVVRRADNRRLAVDDTVARLGKIPGVLGVWPRIHEGTRNLKPNEADDVALHVFHEAEARALLPELRAALPWPAAVITRADRAATAKQGIAHRTSSWLLLLSPTLFALLLLVVTMSRQAARERYEIGVLKAVGWSTSDILTRQLFRTLLVGVPAVVFGLLVAFFVVFYAGAATVADRFLGASSQPLTIQGSASTMVTTVLVLTTLVLIPFLGAALVGAARGALVDPGELLTRRPS
jgi:hypothetical protein